VRPTVGPADGIGPAQASGEWGGRGTQGGRATLHVNGVAQVPNTGISYGAGFTHKKNNLGVGLHAVVLVSG
jgi:hypothetical protein